MSKENAKVHSKNNPENTSERGDHLLIVASSLGLMTPEECTQAKQTAKKNNLSIE